MHVTSPIDRLILITLATILAGFFLTVEADESLGEYQSEEHAYWEESPSLDAFKSRYDEIMQAVEAGRLEQGIGQRARELWISLRKELLHLNTRIEVFKLEADEYDGARRKQALEGLIQAAAERQRELTHYARALDRLVVGHESVFCEPMVEAAENPDRKRGPKGETQFKIEFAPEDLTNPSAE